MLEYVQSIDLKGKAFLELGAGSALLSFYADREGAKVTASDISETVVKNIIKNQERNQQKFTVIRSNLCEQFPSQKFDIILINPPYYKKTPKTNG